MLSVPFQKLYRKMLCLGPDPPAFQQSGDVVDADYVAVPPRGSKRCISATTPGVAGAPHGTDMQSWK